MIVAASLCCFPALACNLAAQGEGRVAAIIDGRTLRLDDGREVRLAGLELVASAPERRRAADALAAPAHPSRFAAVTMRRTVTAGRARSSITMAPTRRFRRCS